MRVRDVAAGRQHPGLAPAGKSFTSAGATLNRADSSRAVSASFSTILSAACASKPVVGSSAGDDIVVAHHIRRGRRSCPPSSRTRRRRRRRPSRSQTDRLARDRGTCARRRISPEPPVPPVSPPTRVSRACAASNPPGPRRRRRMRRPPCRFASSVSVVPHGVVAEGSRPFDVARPPTRSLAPEDSWKGSPPKVTSRRRARVVAEVKLLVIKLLARLASGGGQTHGAVGGEPVGRDPLIQGAAGDVTGDDIGRGPAVRRGLVPGHVPGGQGVLGGLGVPVPQDAPSGSDVGCGHRVCDASCGACGSSLCTMTHSGRFRRFADCAARTAAMPGLARGRFAELRAAASPSKSLSVRVGSRAPVPRLSPMDSETSPLFSAPTSASAVPDDLPDPPSDPPTRHRRRRPRLRRSTPPLRRPSPPPTVARPPGATRRKPRTRRTHPPARRARRRGASRGRSRTPDRRCSRPCSRRCARTRCRRRRRPSVRSIGPSQPRRRRPRTPRGT